MNEILLFFKCKLQGEPNNIAQFAFKILMIHLGLRFTLFFAFHCVLHRLQNHAFKFRPCDHTPPGTQTQLSRAGPDGHVGRRRCRQRPAAADARRSPVGIVCGQDYDGV